MQCKVFVLDCQGTLCQSTSTQPGARAVRANWRARIGEGRSKKCASVMGAQKVQRACRIQIASRKHRMPSLASIRFVSSPDVRCTISRPHYVSTAGSLHITIDVRHSPYAFPYSEIRKRWCHLTRCVLEEIYCHATLGARVRRPLMILFLFSFAVAGLRGELGSLISEQAA